MLNIIGSEAHTSNPNLVKVKRDGRENNLQWLERNLSPVALPTKVVLIGGTGQYSFRLRVAQSHVRHDMTPSSWSHIMLLGPVEAELKKTEVTEISLNPPGGFGYPPMKNCIQKSSLGEYISRSRFPNIAVLGIPVDPEAVKEAIRRFQFQRTVLDPVDLILRWLGFCWGVSNIGNPLLDSQGIPSAAMLDVIIGAAGYDLTPGLESRSSCPEAVWQAAKWWYQYYQGQNRDPINGVYCVDHELMRF
jgi:hypothetical protein